MTNEAKQTETEIEISSMGNYDPDFDDAFADLDEPIQIESIDDWIASNSADLARSVAADPTVLRTLLSELRHLAPHLPGMLRQQVADAVAHHGLAAHWLDYVDAHVA